MQEKNIAHKELQENQVAGSKLSKLTSKPATMASTKRVHYPDYWKKKKLNAQLVIQLESTAKKDAVIKDRHGEYKDGTFLHGNCVVVVDITNELWSVGIHSDHPIGLPIIREIRYKYVPDAFLMTQLFPSRKEKSTDCSVMLFQMPDPSQAEKKEEV